MMQRAPNKFCRLATSHSVRRSLVLPTSSHLNQDCFLRRAQRQIQTSAASTRKRTRRTPCHSSASSLNASFTRAGSGSV